MSTNTMLKVSFALPGTLAYTLFRTVKCHPPRRSHRSNVSPMNYNLYMLGIAIANLFSWTAFALVITKLSPCLRWLNNNLCTLVNTKSLIAFYATLFLALTGSLAIIGFYLRVYLKKNELYYENINIAFRQGILISFAVCGLLALQSFRVLTWWDSLILVLLLIITEFAFLKKISNKEV